MSIVKKFYRATEQTTATAVVTLVVQNVLKIDVFHLGFRIAYTVHFTKQIPTLRMDRRFFCLVSLAR